MVDGSMVDKEVLFSLGFSGMDGSEHIALNFNKIGLLVDRYQSVSDFFSNDVGDALTRVFRCEHPFHLALVTKGECLVWMR